MIEDKIFAALGCHVPLDTSIYYLKMDSLEYLNFLIELGIPFDDASNFVTLHDIADYLQARDMGRVPA